MKDILETLNPQDRQRYLHYHRVRREQFPEAVQAYLIFYAAITPSADEYELMRIEEQLRGALVCRKNAELFIETAQDACKTLLGIPKEADINAVEILLATAELAKNPSLGTAEKEHTIISNLFSCLDEPTATYAVNSLVQIERQMQRPGYSKCHWEDAFRIFKQKPELFGYQQIQ